MGIQLLREVVANGIIEQNPYAGVGPVVGKVLIVCPVSLVNVSVIFFCLHRANYLAELESRVPQVAWSRPPGRGYLRQGQECHQDLSTCVSMIIQMHAS